MVSPSRSAIDSYELMTNTLGGFVQDSWSLGNLAGPRPGGFHRVAGQSQRQTVVFDAATVSLVQLGSDRQIKEHE
jgi:hypothetical protein